eukprot:10248919-Karenia_brevis.AAC.1
MIVRERVRPRHENADWGRHIFRELNTVADGYAGRHNFSYECMCTRRDFANFRLCFDDSVRGSGSGGGW